MAFGVRVSVFNVDDKFGGGRIGLRMKGLSSLGFRLLLGSAVSALGFDTRGGDFGCAIG